MSRFIPVTILIMALLGIAGHQVYEHYFNHGATSGRSAYQVLVEIDQVRRDEFLETLEALGTASARDAVDISASVTATISQIHFNDGERVEAGDLLVQLEASGQQGIVKEEMVKLQDEQRQLDHYKKLARTNSISQTQLDEQQARVDIQKATLKAAQGELDHFTITAPFSGTLGVRRVSVGALVKPGTVITTLDDLSVINVDFTIPETFLQSVEKGLTILCKTDAWPGEVFEGVVTHIDSRVNPVTRALAVRARLDNQQGRLRPGMLLSLDLIRNRTLSLMIPEKALAPMKGEQYVFVPDENNIAHRRAVRIGRRLPGKVEILAGLQEGESIVVEGGYRLQEGVPVVSNVKP
ncbi:MAG: efflux RND transporter periplasmic adaptor subunit [Pseudomonadales bacterium]|nr:efflux RND transporter periplasmic adaptor subunit [Pseudomonadales bacterium]